MVSSFSQIITLIADSELSLASSELCAGEVREMHLFMMTRWKGDKDNMITLR